MNDRIHPKLDLLFAVTEGLEAGAREVIKAARKRYTAHRRRRGGTLRPGAETPLWTALVEEVQPFLQQRGERAKLARWLELDDARVGEFFVRRTAMPDAERTILLIHWLALRKKGEWPG